MKKIWIFILPFLLCSCAISFIMPDNRFETSETSGGVLKGEFYSSLGRGKDVELTPDFSSTWADTESPLLKKSSFLAFGAKLGLHQRLDLGLSYVGDLGLVAKAKLQLIGKKGEKGLQLATVFSTGSGNESKAENSNTATSAELENSFVGADLILGYRSGKSLLLYLSAFQDRASFDLRQSRGDTTRHFSGKSKNIGATMGLNLGLSENVDVLLEYARAKTTSAQSRIYADSVGGRLGFDF